MMKMSEIERLDLKTLKNLVALKEKNKDLLKLESRRERLRAQLDETDQEIREYLHRRPSAKSLLDALRAAAIGKAKGKRVNRPRGWLRHQVTTILKASRQPITPARIRDLIATRYPEQATKNLYISVFQLLKRNPEFKKTKEGWVLTRKATTKSK